VVRVSSPDVVHALVITGPLRWASIPIPNLGILLDAHFSCKNTYEGLQYFDVEET
jgi:hypothetical protein